MCVVAEQGHGIAFLELCAHGRDFDAGLFVHLAGEAPVGGEIHDYWATFTARLCHGFRTPALPVNSARRFLQRAGCVRRCDGRAPVELIFEREGVTAYQQNKDDDKRNAFAGATALNKLAKNPRGERDEHEKDSEPQNRFAVAAGSQVE